MDDSKALVLHPNTIAGRKALLQQRKTAEVGSGPSAIYWDEKGSPHHDFRLSGPWPVRTVRCRCADFTAVIADLANTPFPYINGGNNPLYPFRIASVPDEKTKLESAGQFGLGLLANYVDCLITVYYRSMYLGLVVEEIKPHLWVRPGLRQGLYWGSGQALYPDESPVRIECGHDYILTRYRVPESPVGVAAAAGFVNSDTVTSWVFQFAYPPETLLFMPEYIKHGCDNDGATNFQVGLKFQYRPNSNDGRTANGWNYFWNGTTQQYEEIYLASGAQYKPYKSTPLTGFLA